MKAFRSLICFVYVCFNLSLVMSSGDIASYFPQINGNISMVTWAHAVNSKEALTNVLKDDSIMMIEADILMGKLKGKEDKIPIMAHPPDETSDLSLEDFLNQIIDFNKGKETKGKGVKLDFKQIEAFTSAKDFITKANQEKFPLWLNADITKGTTATEASVPLDSDNFFSVATAFSDATLSLGWTTTSSDHEYTAEHMINMRNELTAAKKYNLKNKITFAVRASMTANSEDALKSLLEGYPESTLTIWSATNDKVDVDKLRSVILSLGIDKFYMDVSDELRNSLNNPSSASILSGLSMAMCVVTVLLCLF